MENEDRLSTKLTNEQLKELLDAYRKRGIVEPDKEWINTHRARAEKARASFLHVHHLKSATDEELAKDLIEHYRWAVRIPMHSAAIERNLDKVRAGLLYLVESKDDLRTKVNEVLHENGRYRVPSVGKAFWSTLFQALDPSRNPLWNNKTEQALDSLGMRYWNPGDSPGQVYAAIQKAQLALAALQEDLDLYMVDHFMHYVTAMEGKAIVDRWTHQARTALSMAGSETRPTVAAPRYWRITLPTNLRGIDIWGPCLEHGIAAIGFPDNEANFQVRKLKEIRIGDRVAAFLLGRKIGGIGTVTAAYDPDLPDKQPKSQDYFQGTFWRRIGVDWLQGQVDVQSLTGSTRNKFVGQTVIEISKEEFDEVASHINPNEPRAFRGFSKQAFQFFTDLSSNNNKTWFRDNRAIFESEVDVPLRALMEDLARELIIKLDPNLETTISARTTISRINKNLFGSAEEGLYNEWYWGAFYRRERNRLTDAQLFVLLEAAGVRTGLSFGKGAADVLNMFCGNVRQNLGYFQKYISENALDTTYRFEAIDSQGTVLTPLDAGLDEGIARWLEGVELNIVKTYTPDNAVLERDSLVNEIKKTFTELYLIYLFAVAERPVEAAEQYLASIVLTPPPTPYTDEDFLKETYLERRLLAELKEVVQDKKQIILVGPPGTGKTYVAQKFARLLAGGDETRVELIQFHPSYEYEEFMEGIRPESKETTEGTQVISYPVRAGAFKHFCERARGSNGNWVMIIDEINRGNIAKIFGELLYLLEYRDCKVVLPYSGQSFSIPSNVFILGTMNTADRSIALVDFALRRRFHFVRMAADRKVLERYLERHPDATREALAYFDRANDAIDDPDYKIGFSYFMKPDLTEADIELTWRYSIFPHLQEYYYEDRERLDQLTWEAVQGQVGSRSED